LRFLMDGWIILSILSGCDDTDCTTTSTSDIIIAFYDQDSLYEKPVSFDIVTAMGTDSLFYDQDDISSTFILPAFPATDSTVFLFQNHSGSIDTLVVGYKRSVQLISETCGFVQIYSELSASTTFPDVDVVSNELDSNDDIDIKIFI